MWPYPWTHVGTPSQLGHMDRVAATMPSQAHAGAAQEAPDIGQWEGQDVPLVRPSSCNVKGGIPSSRRYLPTYLGLDSPQFAASPPCRWCHGPRVGLSPAPSFVWGLGRWQRRVPRAVRPVAEGGAQGLVQPDIFALCIPSIPGVRGAV